MLLGLEGQNHIAPTFPLRPDLCFTIVGHKSGRSENIAELRFVSFVLVFRYLRSYLIHLTSRCLTLVVETMMYRMKDILGSN